MATTIDKIMTTLMGDKKTWKKLPGSKEPDSETLRAGEVHNLDDEEIMYGRKAAKPKVY